VSECTSITAESIIVIITTTVLLVTTKWTKFVFGGVSAPDFVDGAHNAPQTPSRLRKGTPSLPIPFPYASMGP